MRKKQLAINLIANIVSFFSLLLISFFLTPYLIKTIGKEAYGFYPMSNNFVGYLTIITLALNSMASRFITIEIAKKNMKKAQEYFCSVFFSNVILTLILCIPMLVIVCNLDAFLDIPAALLKDVTILFALVFLSMLVSIFTSVFGVATFAKDRLDLKSGSEIVLGILKIALYIFLFTVFSPSLVFIGVVALVRSFVNLVMQISFTKKLLPSFRLSFSSFSTHSVKELLSSGIWNSLNSLGSQLLLGVVLLLTNMFIGASVAGEIAIIQTLPALISSIICMLFSVFMPRITMVYAENSVKSLTHEVLFSQKVIGLMGTTPVLLVMLFGQDFFSLWVPTEDAYHLAQLSFLTLLPLIVHANMWTIYGLNIVLNKVKFPSLMLIVTGVLSVALSLIGLEFFAKNVFVIVSISVCFNVGYYLLFIPLYASKQLGVKYKTFYTHIIKVLVFSIAFIGVGMVLKKFIVITNWLSFFIWGGCFGLCGIVINALIVIKKSEFIKIKKYTKDAFFKRNCK